jgi:glucan phosphorylase
MLNELMPQLELGEYSRELEEKVDGFLVEAYDIRMKISQYEIHSMKDIMDHHFLKYFGRYVRENLQINQQRTESIQKEFQLSFLKAILRFVTDYNHEDDTLITFLKKQIHEMSSDLDIGKMSSKKEV